MFRTTWLIVLQFVFAFLRLGKSTWGFCVPLLTMIYHQVAALGEFPCMQTRTHRSMPLRTSLHRRDVSSFTKLLYVETKTSNIQDRATDNDWIQTQSRSKFFSFVHWAFLVISVFSLLVGVYCRSLIIMSSGRTRHCGFVLYAAQKS